MELTIAPDDPQREDVRALLEIHLAFSRSTAPAGFAFALDVEGLLDPAVSFFSARRSGELIAVGALKELAETDGELKSMHTSAAARRQGVGAAMVRHLLGLARERGYRTVSLETSPSDSYAPARALYRSVGFEPCGPFADYQVSPYNTFMRFDLGAAPVS